MNMLRVTEIRLGRSVLLLALCAAFLFGAIVQVALAGHFHTYNEVNHGVVHGNDVEDGSFFGRTESLWITTLTCYVGDAYRGWYAGAQTTGGTYGTCSLWSVREGAPGYVNECSSLSYNAASRRLDGHTHGGHYYGGYCQVYVSQA